MNNRPPDAAADAAAPASPFPLVGLGASAGGIRALQTFFEQMPAESGMAFVVIMHLSPDYESNLAQILQNRTAMPVVQVTEPIAVAPNRVYVIPPSKHLILQEGHIHLVEPQQAAGKRLAVDLFFRTLAATYGPRAIAIVLSGIDGDGSIGIKHIKEQGGLTLAQEPAEAEFDSMPRFAIKTGMVDWVLPAAQMPARLLEFLNNETRMHIPPEEPQSEADAQAEDLNSGGPPVVQKVASAGDEEALIEVLRFVRAQTGHDFTHYKRATILRRVARRMQVNLLEDIPSYLSFLQAQPEEAVALLHDLLISVTNFFRDAPAFAALEGHIPQLFADKAESEQVRVWVAGCATGEEAYSVAMLLAEHADRLEAPPGIQVFATDLDANAILAARGGLYPAAIEADVSPERLQRFFQREESGYRIKQELRERVLFSVHNVLKDAPFSRLDLVTCRNLLIYLNRDAQETVFNLFHFALRTGGLLFLGSAESISDGHMLFAPLDRKYRLFVRRATPRTGRQLPTLPTSVPSASRPAAASASPSASLSPPDAPLAWNASLPLPRERSPFAFGDLHLSLLEQYAPPSLVVNAAYDIVHLSAHAARFLQFTGELSPSLLQAAHPALRLELQTALFRATHQQSPMRTSPVPVEIEGVVRSVTVHVRPARPADMGEGFLLVVFETEHVASGTPEEAQPPPDTMAHYLQEEVLHLRRQLSATVEQYEASLEELKASAEEHQSMMEEMRSAAEELETSKEEFQSANEELTTVNQELKSSVDELSRANGDLQNLMASMEIGTIFLDRQLRIKRYTPRIRELFNIIPTDIGRPLSDITHKLNHPSFTEDAEHVLTTLMRSEREVRNEGRHFLARMLPYRTPDDHIDGLVLTFVDITERKRAEEALHAAEMRMRLIVESARDYAIFTTDLQRRVNSWNAGAEAMFGYAEPEILGHSGDILFTPEDRQAGAPQRELETARTTGKAENERWHSRKDGSQFYGSGMVTPLRDDADNHIGYVKVMRDLTESKQAEEALRRSEIRQTFLVKLGDALRSLTESIDIEAVASRTLGEQVGADRAFYSEVHPGDIAVIAADYHADGVIPVVGRHRLEIFGASAMQILQDGHTLVYDDVASIETLSPAERNAYRRLGVGALIKVPLVKDRRFVAFLGVHQRTPRSWRPEEIALVEETAERTWSAVERARAESALRVSEDQYRTLFSSIDEGFCTIEVLFDSAGKPVDYRFLETNPAFTRQTGLENAVGRTMREFRPELEEFWFETYGRIAKTKEAMRFEHIAASLGKFFDVYAFPIGSSGENRVAILFNDIFERKRIEAALRLSEERYRLTVENIRDYAIYTLDTEGCVASWSEGARRVKGYEPEEILGQHFRVFYIPEDQEAGKPDQEIAHAAATGRNEDESWRVRKDGTHFWGNEISTAIRDENGSLQGFVKITRDLTERKRAEEERLEREHETTLLEERNRMAQELHDTLAQGFTAIKFQMDAAEAALQSEQEGAFSHIVRAREIAQQSLLEARRSIQALRSPLIEGSNLSEALQRLAHLSSDGIPVQFIEAGTTRPLPAEVENDLYRIAQEALTNALRHASPHHVLLELIYQEDAVRLRIQDDGQGFDLQAQRHGFGVTGMQERAHRLDTELTIQSALEQGTTITIRVPLPGA